MNLTITQHGLTSFTVCGRCNGRVESKLLNPTKAKQDIRRKYEAHKCKEVAQGSASEPKCKVGPGIAQASS
jgi:hypothetical protein